MRHHRCFGPKCKRRVLPGQEVVWISPTIATRPDSDKPGIVGGIPWGWVHAEHCEHLPWALRVIYDNVLDSVAVGQQLMRVWDEKGRPHPKDEAGRRRFDAACLVQIADIRAAATTDTLKRAGLKR